MELLSYLQKLFAYDAWANRATLESFRGAVVPPERSLKLMAHILGAEWLWMARLGLDARKVAVWPELSLQDCETQARELALGWEKYLASLVPARLKETIRYVNSKGEHWSNSIDDILMHVVMHSSYHRGQIASDMRAHGYTPAYTDFIEGVRRKLIE